MKNNEPINTMKHPTNSIVIASIIIGISFIFWLWLYGQRSTDESITITGSAKETVMADLANYTLSFDKTYPAEMGLTKMIEDFNKKTGIITGYLKYKWIAPESTKIENVSIGKNYEMNGYTVNTQNVISYTLSRTISADIIDLELAKKISNETINKAAQNDIALANSTVNYQYTKLEELRPRLLQLATEDAKVKANAMASSSGRKIGSLQAGRMWVVQVLAKNSVDISDYGSYDLSSVEKDVFVTVNVTFELK
jgi:uncharacterized protein